MGNSSPEPTTVFQADETTFRELVQKLTGAAGDCTGKPPVIRNHSPSTRSHGHMHTAGVRRSTFKLQERRQQATTRKLEIKLGRKSDGESVTLPSSPGCPPTPVHSPMTPHGRDSVFSARVGSESPPSEEEKSITEKGFYLHPSPRKSEPPELLTLFPLTSARQQPWAS